MEHTFEIKKGDHAFACFRQGKGERLILAHCSGGSHRQWQSLASTARSRYEVIAPDFLGYGKSSPFSPWQACQNPDVELLVDLLGGSPEPAHIVGHSYGGAVALGAALRLPHRVRSLTLYEPVAFNLLRDHGYPGQWTRVTRVADRIMDLVNHGRNEAAARTFVRYWENQWAWLFMPVRTKQKLSAAMPKIGAEFADMYGPSFPEEAFLKLTMPVHLMRGSKTKPQTHVLVDILADLIPGSTVTPVARAGHLAPATSPRRTNRHILGWLENLSSRGLGVTEYLETQAECTQ